MVLNFQAPNFAVPEPEESPAEKANKQIMQALQAYVAFKEQQRAQTLQSQQMDNQGVDSYIKAFEVGGPDLANEVARRRGLKNPPALPGRAAAPQPMTSNPFGAVTPVEAASNQSIPSEHPVDLISMWDQFKGGQKPQPQQYAQAPQNTAIDAFNPEKLLNQGKYGMNQFDKQMKLQEYKNRNAPQPVFTKAQAIAAKSLPANAKVIDDNDGSKNETLAKGLRQQIYSSDPYKNLNLIRTTAKNISDAVKNPGAFGDLGMMFDYMKTLDPTSVVREGEQTRFSATGSLSTRAANSLNQLVSGQTVTPEQRREVLKYVKSRLKNAEDLYRGHANPILLQAEGIGVPLNQIDPYYGKSLVDDIGDVVPDAGRMGQAKQALAWANANPNDSRAASVRAKAERELKGAQ
jgi:hypothetical protein